MHSQPIQPIEPKPISTYTHENASCPILDQGPFNRCIRLWKPTVEYLTNPWAYYTRFIEICQHRNARFITFSDAQAQKFDPSQINIILDHHIDYYPIETEIMCRWELEQGVISNIYLFNEFDYTDTGQRRSWFVDDLDIKFYQMLESNGFEIGYHQNAVGLHRAKTGGKRSYSKELTRTEIDAAKDIFARDVDNLRKYFNIRTFIPHGAGESNARLLELPDGYEQGLQWVYNNRSRNGTVKPSLKWRSWSDSNGQRPQLIKVNQGHILTATDNLHLTAWTMGPGVHHVLIHPGRFGHSMPSELYQGPAPDATRAHATPEFTLDQFVDPATNKPPNIPLNIPSLIADSQFPVRPIDAPLPEPKSQNNQYILTDDQNDIPAILSISNTITAMLLNYQAVSDPADYKLVRGSAMRTSENRDTIQATFTERFGSFYNTILTDQPIAHLNGSAIPYAMVLLRNLTLTSKRHIRDLFTFLNNLDPHSTVRIIANYAIPTSKLKKILSTTNQDALQGKGFDIVIQGDKKSASIHITRDPSPRPKSSKAISKPHNNPEHPPLLKGLDAQASELTRVLAKLRSQSPEETLNHFGARKLRKLPGGIRRHVAALIDTKFDSTGTKDGYAWAQLPSGRRFYGHPSLKSHQREYAFVADIIDPSIKPETYLIAKDVVSRYVTDWGWFPKELLPSEGGRVVEVGAYMGHKTMRIVDQCVGQSGKVLALELEESNAHTIRYNAANNDMADVIDVVAGGVFNTTGQQRVITRGRQRNSLVNLDKLGGGTGEFVAKVNTLDTLLESWAQPTIDFMIITANGAELEVLQGLDLWFDRVKTIYIAACYTVDGCGTYEPCKEYLLSRGCEILPQSNANVIYSQNPKAIATHDLQTQPAGL